MEFTSHSTQETQAAAATLAALIQPGMWIRLDGQLGAGKTTFTQGFGRALGISRAIKSPTYTIVKEYPLATQHQLIHIDAYRLEEGGADTVDLTLYEQPHTIVLIEWAEFVADSLPRDYLTIELGYGDEATTRHLSARCVGQNPRYQQLLSEWEAILLS